MLFNISASSCMIHTNHNSLPSRGSNIICKAHSHMVSTFVHLMLIVWFRILMLIGSGVLRHTGQLLGSVSISGTISFLGPRSVNTFCLGLPLKSSIGVANVVAEAAWIQIILLELSCPLKRTMIVFCDNVSAMYLASNLV